MDRKNPPSQEIASGWSWAGLAARVILGGVLIFAGASKTAAPVEEFAVVIESYDVLPTDAAQGAAALLPWFELALGFSLVFGYLTKPASAAAGALFGAFLLALLSTKVRGIELPNCGCFGASFHAPTWVTMIMDALLLCDAAVAFAYGSRRLSLDNWADPRYTPLHAP
jgi:uncharacterized membrane protein YphA (DoxX/SURF4 family)